MGRIVKRPPLKQKKAESGSAARVRKHRQKMREQGLKPKTLWLPDTNSPEYRAEIARAIKEINNSADEKIILEELSHIEIDGWK